MKTKTLFLTLKVFSATGGIEKVCRVAGKALQEIGVDLNFNVRIFSMYDPVETLPYKYFTVDIFKAFNINKIDFALKSIREGIKSGVVILSHVNLLLIGYLVKLFSPRTKLILLAHGIEVWKPFPIWKKSMLHKCDRILPVSHFTKEKMKALYQLKEEKFTVLNNCLDPFLPAPDENDNSVLLSRYGFTNDNFILISVSRISANEQYKGLDKVIRSMQVIIKEFSNVRYLIVGKSEVSEKTRLDNLIEALGLTNAIVFAGYISDEELPAHYSLADVYIMPSEKEGFGIVFIEAMFYGLPVIAGNKDGSVDALCNGKLGILVDPDNQEEMNNAVTKIVRNETAFIPDRDLLMNKFSFNSYKGRLKKILQEMV